VIAFEMLTGDRPFTGGISPRVQDRGRRSAAGAAVELTLGTQIDAVLRRDW
jgi:hypothetical protein